MKVLRFLNGKFTLQDTKDIKKPHRISLNMTYFANFSGLSPNKLKGFSCSLNLNEEDYKKFINLEKITNEDFFIYDEDFDMDEKDLSYFNYLLNN